MDEKSEIMKIYDCENSPLRYMIEPRGTIEIVGKDDETRKEDLERLLPFDDP